MTPSPRTREFWGPKLKSRTRAGCAARVNFIRLSCGRPAEITLRPQPSPLSRGTRSARLGRLTGSRGRVRLEVSLLGADAGVARSGVSFRADANVVCAQGSLLS